MGKFRPNRRNNLGRHARKAAQIMAERGWVRHIAEDSDGRVCLVGAFARAVSPIPELQRGTLRATFALDFGAFMEQHWPGEQPEQFLHAPGWNDKVFTSQEEALAWLNKYADHLDPQR